jgi:hypothetical protein
VSLRWERRTSADSASRAFAQAAASALALDDLRGLSAPVVAARRVAVQLCDRASIARSEIAHGLELSMRAVRMIVAEPFDVALARAVCVRLALEELRARQQKKNRKKIKRKTKKKKKIKKKK